jgi:hypothetical protein
MKDWAREKKFDLDEVVSRLVSDRLLAWVDKFHVRIISPGELITAFMASGQTIVTSEAELAGLWVEEKLSARKKRRRVTRPISGLVTMALHGT